ncbi:MAG: ABC transporter ATP-binding protein [Actinomycetota bacterium]
MSSPILRAHDLVKSFRATRAVDGVGLSVAPGERVGLLGPNGAGKTTTLFMLLGVITPDSGGVEIAGHRLPHGRIHALSQVGFAASYLPLAERMRVHEFLRLYGQLYGIADPTEAIRAGLERFGIGELIDAMGHELSSGQRTIIGIVKATLHDPALLVLDEPTASLDPEVALRVRTGLHRICDEQGTALLMTSHNMPDVERLCQRVIFLSDGRIAADDTPEAVAARFSRADLEGVFLHLAAGGREARVAHDETDRPV